MKDIQNEEWLDSLTDGLQGKLSRLNLFIIKTISRRIGNIYDLLKKGYDVGTVSEYAAEDLRRIKKELKKTRKESRKEIDSIFNRLAAANVDFANDFYEYRGLEVPKDWRKNKTLVRIVKRIKKENTELFDNLSKSQVIGFKGRDGSFQPVTKEYYKIINSAVIESRLGEQPYMIRARQMIKEMTRSGLRSSVLDDGKTYRVDSQVIQDMKAGMATINHEMQTKVGEEFGADGWEISAHALCAPDHQDIQGKRYTKKEYEELQKKLERPIGTHNCRHFATPVILAVDKPVYSADELKKIKERSNQIVEYKGKLYTRYEASQVQRQYEVKLRDAHTALEAFQAAGDQEQEKRIRRNIRVLNADYKKFSSAVGLKPRMDRTKI